MNKLKFISLLAGIFIAGFANAQFSLTGEFRPRTEFSHGYKSLATKVQKTSTITNQRTRLNFLYKNEWINTKLVLQDVRLWGNQPQLVNNEDYAVSVHEAWAAVNFSPEFSLQAGRQELAYDDHRIFGNVGWAQQAQSHDVALLKYEKDVKIHFGIAHHENSNITNNFYDGPDAYKDLQFIWVNKTWDKNSLSLLAVNNGIPVMEQNNQVSKYCQTLGGRFSSVLSFATLSANLYYQTGKHVSGKDISALNYLVEASLKNGLSAVYEYLSGNSYDKNDKNYAFNPLYGTNHKFNGFMDYFFVGNHMNSVGLGDAYLKYKFTKNKFSLNSDLHYFSSARKISESADKYLGTELDITASYKINDLATLSGGWSVMIAGDSMEFLKGGDKKAGNQWAYIMLSVMPVFVK